MDVHQFTHLLIAMTITMITTIRMRIITTPAPAPPAASTVAVSSVIIVIYNQFLTSLPISNTMATDLVVVWTEELLWM